MENMAICSISPRDLLLSISPSVLLLEGNGPETIQHDFIVQAFDRVNGYKGEVPADVKAKVMCTFSSDDLPVYGQKKVYSEPSGLLARRGLSPLSVRDVGNFSLLTDKGLPPLNTLGLKSHLNTVDENLLLYKQQVIKFNNTLSAIDKGNEAFFPDNSKKLFGEYRDVLPHMLEVNTEMGTNLAKEIKARDPSFNHPLLQDSTSRGK